MGMTLVGSDEIVVSALHGARPAEKAPFTNTSRDRHSPARIFPENQAQPGPSLGLPQGEKWEEEWAG